MRVWEIPAEDIQALCRQAPEYAPLARRFELAKLVCGEDLFAGIVQSIAGQQLSVRAADAIFRRVALTLGTVSAERLLAADPEELRCCGLSRRKIATMRNIASAQCSGAVDLARLAEKSDAEIIAELVKFPGVGVWTAEMLLIFCLGRPDVLSFRDLGIRRGLMKLYDRKTLALADFAAYRKRCSPYGTLASFYLWRLKDAEAEN